MAVVMQWATPENNFVDKILKTKTKEINLKHQKTSKTPERPLTKFNHGQRIRVGLGTFFGTALFGFVGGQRFAHEIRQRGPSFLAVGMGRVRSDNGQGRKIAASFSFALVHLCLVRPFDHHFHRNRGRGRALLFRNFQQVPGVSE